MPEGTHKSRVLVIDDAETTRYVFRRILAHAGFEVEEAATGREGLLQAMSLPDLVISDVNLPDMLGYEVCRRLKANPLTASIPVLQVSAAFVSDESKVQGLEGGADAYLAQPLEPMVLVAQVQALLRMRRAESLSHHSALQWQATFDCLSDGLVVTDRHGTLLRANATFMKLLDLTQGDVEGRPLRQVLASRFGAEFEAVSRNAARRHDAELAWGNRWFRVHADAIESAPDDTSGTIVIVTEITEQKKLQETLKLSERLAATGRLAHVIAHEINNPLEAMSNLLYLASQESEEPGQARVYVAQAATELQRISTITKQILAYNRESSVPSPVDAGEILESVLAMLRTSIAMRKVRVDLRAHCHAQILVRSGEIRQVFNNFISNALDAMGLEGGTLRVRCIPSASYPAGRRGVRFLFSDSGSGISHEVLPRIFDAFFTTKETRGSGIGLWLSGEVLGKHGALIRIRTRTAGAYRGTLVDVFFQTPDNPSSE